MYTIQGYATAGPFRYRTDSLDAALHAAAVYAASRDVV